jgi:hypothetical protein
VRLRLRRTWLDLSRDGGWRSSSLHETTGLPLDRVDRRGIETAAGVLGAAEHGGRDEVVAVEAVSSILTG